MENAKAVAKIEFQWGIANAHIFHIIKVKLSYKKLSSILLLVVDESSKIDLYKALLFLFAMISSGMKSSRKFFFDSQK